MLYNQPGPRAVGPRPRLVGRAARVWLRNAAGRLAALKASYDGYHFAEPSPDIYNPFSLLSAFAEGRIRPFWFGSGTPTFLIELLRENGWDISNLEGRVARESSFDVPTERMRTPLPMLYQGGYLTIKSYDPVRQAYTLGIPNEEVSRGLSESLGASA